MKVSVEYDVTYNYVDTVTINDNTLRVFPSQEYWQEPLSEEIKINPEGKVFQFKDRFGNKNARVYTTTPHNNTNFNIKTIVQTKPYKSVAEGDHSLPLKQSSLPSDVKTFLGASTLVNPELIKARFPHITEGYTTLEDALVSLTKWVTEKIQYVPKSTNIETKAREALALGTGVCQDKSHILIGLLRILGIPARYVSGVLVDTPGDTHAWVEAYWPEIGWIPSDPTHNRVFDLENYYVKFAHGRDYNDVPPITGVFESDSPNSTTKLNVIPKILEK